MSTLYRIYCTEPGDVGWQEEWSDTAITTCPNNAAHSVNPNSVQTLRISVPLIRVSIEPYTINETFYFRIANFEILPQREEFTIREIKCIAFQEGDITSFDIQIVDTTNQNLIATQNSTNTNEQTLVDLGTLSNIPTDTATLEVWTKRNGGSTDSSINIVEVVFYS